MEIAMITKTKVRCVFIFIICFSAMGCAATIHAKDGAEIRGEIVRSDAIGVVVEMEGQGEVRIARSDISEISHPGLGAAIAGTALFVTGGAMAIGGVVVENNRGNGGGWGPSPGALLKGGGIILLLAGAIPAVVGWRAWGTSKSRAEPTTKASEIQLAPVALTNGEETYYGGGASMVW